MQEYEEKAVTLATNPTMLRNLTADLRASRLSSPLFDTTRWVRKSWNLVEIVTSIPLGNQSVFYTSLLSTKFSMFAESIQLIFLHLDLNTFLYARNNILFTCRSGIWRGHTLKCGTCTALAVSHNHLKCSRMMLNSLTTNNSGVIGLELFEWTTSYLKS